MESARGWRPVGWDGGILEQDLTLCRPGLPSGAGGRGEERRRGVYMVNRASAGRSAFLPALGVELATEGRSPPGGDGKVGTISAALARSSRNLSNSVEMGRWIRLAVTAQKSVFSEGAQNIAKGNVTFLVFFFFM